MISGVSFRIKLKMRSAPVQILDFLVFYLFLLTKLLMDDIVAMIWLRWKRVPPREVHQLSLVRY